VAKDRVWKPVATENDFPFKEKFLGLMGICVAPKHPVGLEHRRQ
jgi:hypothetical protein